MIQTATPTIRSTMARHIFIVSRGHRELYEYLAAQFQSDKNVDVILDRRIADRDDGSHVVSERRVRPGVDEELKSRSHAVVTVPDY
jgi:hypothetical protein